MKFYTLFLILLPLVSFGQDVTFTSVFQTNQTEDSLNIYHVKLECFVTKSFISIYRFEGEKKILTFTLGVNFQTSDNNTYMDYDPKGNVTTFVLKEQRLVIKNSSLTYTVYGKIPAIVKTFR